MSCDLLPYVISGSSQDLPLLVIPMIYSFLLVAMFFFHSSYLPPPIHTIGAVQSSIVMLHVGSMLFISAFLLFFTLLYFILLCHIHHRLL